MNEYKIAICDDEELALINISKIVNKSFSKLGVRASIDNFNESTLLIQSNTRESYSIVFLDIDMPYIDGIETAKILKVQNPKLIIVFVTSKDDLVYKSFEAHPYGFIRKSILEKEIHKIIQDIIKINLKELHAITFKINGINYKININEITHIMSNGNYILINTIDEQIYKYKGSINEKESELSDYGFIRTHERYIVNLKYIYKINKNSIILTQKFDVPMSRSRTSEVKDSFISYYGKKLG